MPSLAQITALSRQFDAALNQFKAIDLGKTDKERYGEISLPAYDPNQKSYPTLYLDGDEFMDLPDSGEAVMSYQITRRSTDERKGKKKHSITIEVRSIDPKAAAKAMEKKKAEGRAVPIKTEFSEFARGDQAAKFIKSTPALAHLRPGSVHSGTAIESVLKKRFKPNTWGAQTVPHLRQKLSDAIKHERFITKRLKGERGIADAMRSIYSAPIMGTRKKPVKGAYVPDSRFSEFNRPRDGDGQFVANTTGGADPVTMRQAYGPDPKKSKLLAPGAAAAAVAGTAGLLGTKTGRGMLLKGTKGASRVVRSAVTGIQRKAQGRSTERYPIMGSKAPKGKPGFGETLMRQRMRGD